MGNQQISKIYKSLISKQHFYVVFVFAIIALALLAPLASNTYILSLPPDFANHTGAVVQAKQAIREGQFPLRVAPWQFNQLRYPLYQFYANSPYTIAGFVNYLGVNPFASLKITLWLALMLGGIYMYRMAFLLCRSSVVALFAGVVYIGAPYFITNIIWRGAFAEAAAQGIVPMALFYTYQIYNEKYRTKTFCLAALSWFLLVTSHIITFAYTAMFISLFIFLLFLKDCKKWKTMLISGLAIVSGMVLALWFLAPILLLQKVLQISNSLTNPFTTNWLTSLASLFSIRAAPPLQDAAVYSIPCAIGLPIVMSVGIILCSPRIKSFKLDDTMRKLVIPLFVLFVLAFFMVWSPFDFWKFLPQVTHVAQFSYRLLTQVMWIGALLFVFAVYGIFGGNLNSRRAAVGIFLLCLSSGYWLHFKGNHGAIHVDKIIESPSAGVSDYFFKSELVPNFGTDLSLLSSVRSDDGWLVFNKKINIPYDFVYKNPDIKIQLYGKIPKSTVTWPIKASVKINGGIVVSKEFKSGLVFWKFPVRKFIRPNQYGSFELEFAVDKPFVPALLEPTSTDHRALAINVDSIEFVDVNSKNKILFANNCKQNGNRKECIVKVDSLTSWVQFPQLYYPKLLDVRVDGKSVKYYPIGYNDKILTAVKLDRGNYNVSIDFRGLFWANWIGASAWLILIVIFMFDIFYSFKMRIKNSKD